MICSKQVAKDHYRFQHYMSKTRWASLWHQLNEISSLSQDSILEIGPGSGVLKAVATSLGIEIKTLDFDADLNPDFVGSVERLPFADSTYEVVCAFQVLEHLPYEKSLASFKELVRVSSQYVVISLPDAREGWRLMAQFPRLGFREFFVPRPQLRPKEHIFEGEHYWEINKKGYPLKRVVQDLSKFIPLIRTYRVVDNPYHRFFIFKKA